MRKLLTTLLFTMALAFSGMANALLINDTAQAGSLGGTETDVGGLDTFITKTDTIHDSSEATEETWINGLGLLDSTVTWTVRTADVTYFSVEDVVDSAGDTLVGNIFAFHANGGWDVPNPDYFIIKNSGITALYRNLDDVAWGVFSAGDLGGANVGGSYDFTISHVTEFVGTAASVPEPSISALIGLGLLGMLGVSRRKTVA